MDTRSKGLIIVAAALALAACTSKVNVPGVPDVGGIQNGSTDISAAAQKCSQASGEISAQTQALLRGVKDKDQTAIDAAGAELSAIAEQLHQSASEGLAASDSMASLPMAGAQAEAGIKATFKMCDAIGGFADDLAAKISDTGSHAYKELQAAAESMSRKIQGAADEMTASMPQG